MTFPIYPWRLALPQISGRQEEYVVDQSTLNEESWKLPMLMLPGVSLGVATSYIRPVLSSFLLAAYLYLAPTPKKEMLSELANFKPFNLAAQLQERRRENHEINLPGWENHPNFHTLQGNDQQSPTGKEKSSSNMPVGDGDIFGWQEATVISFFSKPTLIFIPLSWITRHFLGPR